MTKKKTVNDVEFTFVDATSPQTKLIGHHQRHEIYSRSYPEPIIPDFTEADTVICSDTGLDDVVYYYCLRGDQYTALLKKTKIGYALKREKLLLYIYGIKNKHLVSPENEVFHAQAMKCLFNNRFRAIIVIGADVLRHNTYSTACDIARRAYLELNWPDENAGKIPCIPELYKYVNGIKVRVSHLELVRGGH